MDSMFQILVHLARHVVLDLSGHISVNFLIESLHRMNECRELSTELSVSSFSFTTKIAVPYKVIDACL